MKERKLHPISPLFLVVETIGKMIFPALIAIVGSRGSSWELFALAAGLLISLFSIVQYRFYRYWLDEDEIRVKEGVFVRKMRQVKYGKIQNLNLIQNPLHRIFKVAKVQLESASGGKPEAVINVISLNAVAELQNRVHQAGLATRVNKVAGGATDEITKNLNGESEESSPVLLRLGLAEIVRYGIISNRGLIPVGIFFGFLAQLGDDIGSKNISPLIKGSINYVSEGVESLPIDGTLISVIYIIILAIVSLSFLWILSIGMALLQFYGFELKERSKKLIAKMGLLTKIEATIPKHRIQTITVRHSILHRLFDRIGVTIETAGGVNNEQQGVTMKHVAPVLPTDSKVEFLNQIQESKSWSEIEWQPIEARAWRRVFKVSFLLWALVLLVLWLHSGWAYGIGVAVSTVWSFFYAKAYIKNTGYFLSEKMAAFKSGVIFKKETYVRLPKVQTVRLKENLFDRRHKMATLELDTAGATHGAHHVEIPYLNYDVSEKLYRQISTRIKNNAFEW